MAAADVPAIIARVAERKQEWASLPASTKLQFLIQMRDNLERELENWIDLSAKGHGYDRANPAHGHLISEVTLKGPAMFGMWLNASILAYESLASTGRPPAAVATRTTPAGTAAVTVFPFNLKDKVFAGGMRGELYIEDGKVEQYAVSELAPGLAAVLSAGNFDAPTDVLHVMFNQNQVCVCKTNPVNCHSAPAIARILAPLIEANYLAIVGGGIDVGKALLSDASVDRLLMTGAARSYDAILWGAPSEQAANKAAGRKQFTKEFDAELGSVNPYIICPGVWSDSELEAHAQQLVSFKMFNNGHICASPQIVITCKQWPQREAFLRRVRELLAVYPGTRPFYPNCDKSYAEQQQHLPDAAGCKFANPVSFEGQQHPIFATDLPQDHFMTRNEAFCPVLGEVPLDTAADADTFLPTAITYANKACWGSLTGTLIVDPRTQRRSKDAVERAVDAMKFGSVSVNYGAMNSVILAALPWGAYPRHTPEDIQSGIGKIGNSFHFKNVTKAVVWGPFTHPAQAKVPLDGPGRAKRDLIFARYAAFPSALRLMRVIAVVLTGL